jgi:hypothetical protein
MNNSATAGRKSNQERKRRFEYLMNARPHPGLLPRGEGTAIARFWFCERLSGKSSRAHFQSGGG